MKTYRIMIRENSSDVYAIFHEGRRWNLNVNIIQSERMAQGLRSIQDGLIHIGNRIKIHRHGDL